MTYNVRTARRLFSSLETDLYLKSRKSGLRQLSQKQLQRSLIRARRMHERLAERAGRPHYLDADNSARSTLLLEVLHRFERQFAQVMMDPGRHNQKHESPPKPGDKMQPDRLGPQGVAVQARASADRQAQGGSARVDGMGVLQSRRKRVRDDRR